jgi:hypothetical protein
MKSKSLLCCLARLKGSYNFNSKISQRRRCLYNYFSIWGIHCYISTEYGSITHIVTSIWKNRWIRIAIEVCCVWIDWKFCILTLRISKIKLVLVWGPIWEACLRTPIHPWELAQIHIFELQVRGNINKGKWRSNVFKWIHSAVIFDNITLSHVILKILSYWGVIVIHTIASICFEWCVD